MSGASDKGRSCHDDGPVLVTGICGRIGKCLTRVLHRDRRVLGVDLREFPDRPKDVALEQIDLRRAKLRDTFRTARPSAVVHLGVLHDPHASSLERHSWNTSGLSRLLEYVAHFAVPKLVILSSANVYGPDPANPQFLTEEAPLLGGQRFSEMRDLVELDMLAQSFFWRHPATETVILRPVHILGRVRNAASNYLRLPVIPTVLGFDPMLQVIHELDVVRGIELALRPAVRGIFNLAGPSPLPLSHIVKMADRPHIALPYVAVRLLVARLFALGLSGFPPPELDHIRYVCMVDDTRAREVLGFLPTSGIAETLASLEGRRW